MYLFIGLQEEGGIDCEERKSMVLERCPPAQPKSRLSQEIINSVERSSAESKFLEMQCLSASIAALENE